MPDRGSDDLGNEREKRRLFRVLRKPQVEFKPGGGDSVQGRKDPMSGDHCSGRRGKGRYLQFADFRAAGDPERVL